MKWYWITLIVLTVLDFVLFVILILKDRKDLKNYKIFNIVFKIIWGYFVLKIASILGATLLYSLLNKNNKIKKGE